MLFNIRKATVDNIIGMVIAMKETLTPKPKTIKKDARTRKPKRFFSKLMQYM